MSSRNFLFDVVVAAPAVSKDEADKVLYRGEVWAPDEQVARTLAGFLAFEEAGTVPTAAEVANMIVVVKHVA